MFGQPCLYTNGELLGSSHGGVNHQRFIASPVVFQYFRSWSQSSRAWNSIHGALAFAAAVKLAAAAGDTTPLLEYTSSTLPVIGSLYAAGVPSPNLGDPFGSI